MARQKQVKQDPVVAARAIARAEVARRWPELADVEPTVAPRQQHLPDETELGRLGAAGSAPPAAPGGEYTFTFAGQTRTPEGYLMPRVARVIVDAQRRVVKATTSK
ncbi:MAG TPA: hypothetical protein VKE41_01720 [Roseiflexaceae bacterium]|nr:hypothetical protein [Roseiflexaceae bacterium]